MLSVPKVSVCLTSFSKIPVSNVNISGNPQRKYIQLATNIHFDSSIHVMVEVTDNRENGSYQYIYSCKFRIPVSFKKKTDSFLLSSLLFFIFVTVCFSLVASLFFSFSIFIYLLPFCWTVLLVDDTDHVNLFCCGCTL